MTEVRCKKCGAPFELHPDDKFHKCEYCESQIFIDRTGVGFFYVVPFKFSDDEAKEVFKRWSTGHGKAVDLGRASVILSVVKRYYPLYSFERATEKGEKMFIRPAVSTVTAGLHRLKIPGGESEIMDQKFDVGDAEVIEPEIEMSAYLNEMPGSPLEQALVYFPIYHIAYTYEGEEYSITIDGATGEVHASSFPGTKTRPYLSVAILGFVASFLGGALLMEMPLVGAFALVGIVVGTVALGSRVVERD